MTEPRKDRYLLHAALVLFALVTLAALLGWGRLFGCLDVRPSPPRFGASSQSAELVTTVTPGGVTCRFPRWLADNAVNAAEASVEIDRACAGFSEAWRSRVQPALVRVWPLGWSCFPADGGLVSGWTAGGEVTVAWSPVLPRFPALPHELAHVANPWASHSDMQRPPLSEAIGSAARGQMR